MSIQDRINTYWSKRADEFGDARYTDMQGAKRSLWENFIRKHLPDKPEIHALDLGTGAGFFSFILSSLGCEVTAIDYSEEMLHNARENAAKLGFPGIRFFQMNAEELKFEDSRFDLVFTRNVTWTLPDPEKAYKEMVRVLKPGGRIINADANYAQAFQALDETGLTEKMAQENYGSYENPARSLAMLRERNDIAKSLYIAKENRPLWDIQILLKYGIEKIYFDLDINRHEFGFPGMEGELIRSPEFVIVAEKWDRHKEPSSKAVF